MNAWTESLALQTNFLYPLDPNVKGTGVLTAPLELAQFISSPLTLARRRYEKYGEVSSMRMGFQKSLLLLGPDANEFVFMDRDSGFSSRKAWTAAIGLFFPNGLLLMDPPDHLKHRRVMQMAFSSESLASHLAMMSPLIEDSVEQLLPSGQGATRTIKVFPAIKELALRFAAKVFLGEDLGSQIKILNKAFLDTVEASGPGNLTPFVPIPGTVSARGYKGRKILESYFYEKLPEKRKSKEQDFFSLFCHAETADGERFTDREIVDHMIFLMMAAHDTSTMTATTMAYRMAKNPEWQERCRQEVETLPSTHPSVEDLDTLQETDWVIKEALRLQPPLSAYGRVATKDMEFKGYKIRKNNFVALIPSFSHRMPEYWSNPDTFDPERFSPERAEDKAHRFSFVPFGGGLHKCIGLHFGPIEVKTMFTHLLRRYRWTVPSKYKIRYNNTSLGKPWDGLPVQMTRI